MVVGFVVFELKIMDKNSKFCRFCLHKEIEHSNIKLVDISKKCLRKKIEKIGIVISFEDNIPLIACEKCVKFIDQVYVFFENIYISEKALSRLYNNKPNSAADATEKSNKNFPSESIKLEVITNPGSHFNPCVSHVEIKGSQEIIANDKPQIECLNLAGDNSDCSSSASSNISEKYENRPPKSITFPSESHIYPCGNNCSKSFDTFFDYLDHQESHNGQPVFRCAYSKCNKVFSSRRDIVDHENNHMKVSCSICRMEVLPKSLEAHMKKHSDTFKCKGCDSRHTSKAAMEKHFKARHTSLKGYVCHICGKQNSCQSSMNRHLATHLNHRPFKCKLCPYSSKSKTILKVHIDRKHSNEKCACDVCGKMFKSTISLNQHKKRIHTPKKYNCSHCGKYFSEKFNLNQHSLKKHSKQRIYECNTCHQEFFTILNLKNHMHTHRNSCVNCAKCGKVFIYKKYLEKHFMKCNGGKNKTVNIKSLVL